MTRIEWVVVVAVVLTIAVIVAGSIGERTAGRSGSATGDLGQTTALSESVFGISVYRFKDERGDEWLIVRDSGSGGVAVAPVRPR